MLRRTFTALALTSALPLGFAQSVAAQDWKGSVKEFRIGLMGGENTQDRLRRYDGFQKLLEAKLGIPVKLFPSDDYAGVMQGMAASQLDAAAFGASYVPATMELYKDIIELREAERRGTRS